MAVEDFTTAGTFIWYAPAGVRSVTIECWGAGGGGGGNNATSNGGGGGGGGAYARKVFAVTPSTGYQYVVGAKGTGSANANGTAGEQSSFSTVCIALGGSGGQSNANGRAGGAGGQGSLSTGDQTYNGGYGEYGRVHSSGRGGYGGSSAGSAAVGVDSASVNPWTTVTAPAGPTDSGIGGNGGTVGGNAPASGSGGGGGGSGEGTNVAGGNGADGRVRLTYTPETGDAKFFELF